MRFRGRGGGNNAGKDRGYVWIADFKDIGKSPSRTALLLGLKT